ncbi:arrestin domain conatining [Cordyceps militaris]|uniref:Arrestin domain conatining n=1 Tax=Cordyceps militaris TaxID=73501 RepID=A0A2H4S5Q3_CORMI|nr:arrestin domain conatining [Cordyceps militaris]
MHIHTTAQSLISHTDPSSFVLPLGANEPHSDSASSPVRCRHPASDLPLFLGFRSTPHHSGHALRKARSLPGQSPPS